MEAGSASWEEWRSQQWRDGPQETVSHREGEGKRQGGAEKASMQLGGCWEHLDHSGCEGKPGGSASCVYI